MSVTVYSKPSCVQCKSTYRKLDELKIEYKVIDMSKDEEALEFAKGLGYTGAPVIVDDTNPDNHWYGFRPDLIQSLV